MFTRPHSGIDSPKWGEAREKSANGCDQPLASQALASNEKAAKGVPLGIEDLQNFSSNTDDATCFDDRISAFFDAVSSPLEVKAVTDAIQK